MSDYNPCCCGVHVCDMKADAEFTVPVTLLNLPCPSIDEARALFAALKAECAAGLGEPVDLVVDLNISCDDKQVEDFAMTRQMLDRLKSLAAQLGKKG